VVHKESLAVVFPAHVPHARRLDKGREKIGGHNQSFPKPVSERMVFGHFPSQHCHAERNDAVIACAKVVSRPASPGHLAVETSCFEPPDR